MFPTVNRKLQILNEMVTVVCTQSDVCMLRTIDGESIFFGFYETVSKPTKYYDPVSKKLVPARNHTLKRASEHCP